MTKTKQKKILILGGIQHMVDVVVTAKTMGLFTIVTDNVTGSPAKQHADAAYDISTADIDGLAKMAREEKVDGVFTAFEDINTWNALLLCKELQLPFYATKEQLEVCSNKDQFKRLCKSYGLPVIEDYGAEQVFNSPEPLFPVIVKPVDSYASKGITICHTKETFEESCRKALRFSKSQKAIVERFIDNEYGVQLFYTVKNGHPVLTATADRFIFKQDDALPPLPTAIQFPSRHQDQIIHTLDGKIKQMINGLGIQNGLLFIQALYEEGSFYIYEMGFRFGGAQHYHIIEKQTGISLLKMMLDFAVGNSLDPYKIEQYDYGYTPYPACNLSILLKKGTIAEITGLADINAFPSVVSCNLTRSVGDTISVIGAYSQMLGRFNLVANSTDDLHRAIDALYDKLHVRSTEGDNMVIGRFRQDEVFMKHSDTVKK